MPRKGARRWLRAAARRSFSLHTADIVSRRIDQEPPVFTNDANLVLHRVTCSEEVRAQVPTLFAGPFGDMKVRFELLNPLRRARWRREMSTQFRQGDVAYVATKDGEIAGWLWLSRAPSIRDQLSGLRFRLAPGEAYVHHFWTVPRFRQLGTARFVMASVLGDLHNEGAAHRFEAYSSAPRVIGYIDRPNRANLFLTTILFGFQVVQTVQHVRLFSVIGLQVPFTDSPPDGPCSVKRRVRRSSRDSPQRPPRGVWRT